MAQQIKKMKQVSENKFTLQLQTEKNNMMCLPHLKEARNMEKYITKNKTMKQWHRYINLLIIAS